MKTTLWLPVALALLGSSAAPATALAQKVSYDVWPRSSPTRFNTFGFKPSEAPETTAKTTTYDSPIVHERIRSAIAAQLERRGMTRDDQNPDVCVTARTSYKSEYTTYGGWYDPYWYGWGPNYGYPYGWYGGWGGPWYTEERTIGTLTIDLEDAATGALIWRGVGSKHVHETSKPERRAERITEQVGKILEKLPPLGR